MTPHPGPRGATLGCLVICIRSWARPGRCKRGPGPGSRETAETLVSPEPGSLGAVASARATKMAARVQAGRTRVTAAISRHSSHIYLHRSSSHLPLASLVLTAVQQVHRLPPPSEIRSRSPLAFAQADLIPPLFSVLRFVGEISEESELRGK